MLQYNEQYNRLSNQFEQGKNRELPETGIEIEFFRFHSQSDMEQGGTLQLHDNRITENFSFEYPVFTPSQRAKSEDAIVLLHGLNERKWDKYLPWAETLCHNTGRPVILFPIAFHINRAPHAWSDPRNLTSLLNIRRERYAGEPTISYANLALSERICQKPERFYLSGRQTWTDMTVLFEEIKTGRHPLFKEGTQIDLFAYSIGAFLSQVALMANQKELFSDSKLFMFCGGSIFRSMDGISRNIMDKPAFEKMQHYYNDLFGNEATPTWKKDNAFHAFLQMIAPERFKNEREKLFDRLKKRIRGIALEKDFVIPFSGVKEALGEKTTAETYQLLDFDFRYSHENPFPAKSDHPEAVNAAFSKVFSQASAFLAS